MRLVRLEDDECRIGVRMDGRQQQVDGADRISPRLETQEPPELLPLGIGIQPCQLVGDCRARNLRHTPDRDLADFPLGMNVEKLHCSFPAHGRSLLIYLTGRH